ncbi:MAG: hypothetical protein IJX26_03740 [Clostridia bacterium]|nr:hypothetical protein [Clostridia bacterium]
MKINYKKIVFNNFLNSFGIDQTISNKYSANLSYNFNSKNKILKNGVGVSDLKVLNSLTDKTSLTLDTSNLNTTYLNKLLYFKQYFPTSGRPQHRLLLHGSDNKLYVNQMYNGLSIFSWIYSLEFETPPICLTYKLNGADTIILCSDEKMVVWTTNLAPYEVSDVPLISSMCISNGVLFCTLKKESGKVWFCTSLNPELIGTASEYANYFTLDDERGSCRKILTFKENLYVFRDYGITRINYYSPSSISTTQVYLSDSLIYADTITVCGDSIMFLTKDGVYSFNGTSVKKVCLNVEELLDKDNSFTQGCSLQDKYYLALKLNFNDNKTILCENGDFKNNALLVVNLQDYSFEIVRGIDIKSMLALKADKEEKVVVTFNSGEVNKLAELDNSGKYFVENLPKFFSTGKIYAEDLSKMVIRKFVVDCSAGINFKIITNSQTKEFVSTKKGINKFETILPCENFHIELNSTEDECYVRYIEIGYFKA